MNRFDLRLPRRQPVGPAGGGRPVRDHRLDPVQGRHRAEQPGPLSLFADAFPPTLLGAVDAGWVPTIELTVHVRGVRRRAGCSGRFGPEFLMDGLLEEDGELWDSEGRPVALSRQLAMVLSRPTG